MFKAKTKKACPMKNYSLFSAILAVSISAAMLGFSVTEEDILLGRDVPTFTVGSMSEPSYYPTQKPMGSESIYFPYVQVTGVFPFGLGLGFRAQNDRWGTDLSVNAATFLLYSFWKTNLSAVRYFGEDFEKQFYFGLGLGYGENTSISSVNSIKSNRVIPSVISLGKKHGKKDFTQISVGVSLLQREKNVFDPRWEFRPGFFSFELSKGYCF